MNIKISILDIIIFLGILQALAAIVIIRVFKNNIVSRLFCFVLFSFILISFKIEIHTLNIWQLPNFTYFPLAIDLLFQPTLYLYFLAISRANFELKKSHLVHYLPCLLFVIHAIIVYLMVIGIKDPGQKMQMADNFYYNPVKQVEDYLSVIASFVYCFLAFKVLRHNQKQAEKAGVPRNESKDKWLKSIIVLFFIMSVFLAINIVLENIFKLGARTFLYWTIFYAYLSGFLYYISITSIRLPELTIVPISFNQKKVDKEKTQLIAQKLKDIVQQEKLYRNPDLSIHDLAKKMNISASTLSYVINNHFKSSYRDFINEYKIKDVKEMLGDSGNKNLSILGIALEAGFSSEASFYRIFKSKVGMSPKEFKDQLDKNNPGR